MPIQHPHYVSSQKSQNPDFPRSVGAQLCETNPIPRGQHPKNTKRTQFHPGPRPKCAKQTQFPHTNCPACIEIACPELVEGVESATPNFSETNPISARPKTQMRKTNPIYEPFPRNEPNLPSRQLPAATFFAKRTQFPPPRQVSGIPRASQSNPFFCLQFSPVHAKL